MTEIEKANQRLQEYVRWQEFSKMYPQLLTQSQLRQLMNGRHFNGFGRCVRQLSTKRLLIHVPTALDWIESNKD